MDKFLPESQDHKYKFKIGDLVDGIIFTGFDSGDKKKFGGVIIARYLNWLNQPCYHIKFDDGTDYKLPEGRVCV